ncbi:M20/M25/M40 family metallo-hydrolase [Agromyces ramosus]|uniref:Acetylornithine deacetylase/succinyl-diaminopimelate desuccinylase-like protein n=1 Tax=Agromyces ramosus TaxID=33879 RepID=A0ABU0RB56_9MICO|nr:M20/M25/M40 family metallo-hydrolase [Agromyces ramosus]MDQ0895303.1 acetylornithine deacetylase/succinyl-diaminopimelate desuccinylase-like protein [Agromyces ramosus]
MTHGAEVAALTRRLVAIDATNPSLVPGGAGERELAHLIAEWLIARGFEARLLGADPARPSVLARRRGTGGGRTLLLAGHLDTVGGAGIGAGEVGRPERGGPVAPADRIVGRGAYDMAGGLAAAMIAASTAPAGLQGDLVLAFAADEEFGSVGMEELLATMGADAGVEASVDRLLPDAAVVLEPTDLEVTLAHRGFAWYRVEYEGRAAHGSQPALGIDAIDRAIDGLIALRALGSRLDAAPEHPLLGTGSVRVATIEGGSDAATVADRCVLVVERRTLPGEADPRAELERVLAPSQPERVVPLVARPAMEADADSPIARAVLAAVERVTGRPAVRRGDPWWTDAGLIAEAGIPAVLVGAAGGGAHADEEWVSIDSLDRLVEVLEGVILAICGQNGS